MSGTLARSLGALGDAIGGTANVNFDAGTLFIDGTANTARIVATSTLGNSRLDVDLGITARTAAASGASPYLQLFNGNASTDLKTWRLGATSAGALAVETVNDAYSAATQRMLIDASGRVLMPFQPAFHAWGSTSVSVSISGYILALNNTVSNRGSHYNTSTFRFTAPVTGMYMLAHRVTWGSTGSGISVYQAVNGAGSAAPTEVFGYTTGTSYHTTSAAVSVIQLNANDFVDLRTVIYNSSAQTLDLTRCSFSGYLLG